MTRMTTMTTIWSRLQGRKETRGNARILNPIELTGHRWRQWQLSILWLATRLTAVCLFSSSHKWQLRRGWIISEAEDEWSVPAIWFDPCQAGPPSVQDHDAVSQKSQVPMVLTAPTMRCDCESETLKFTKVTYVQVQVHSPVFKMTRSYVLRTYLSADELLSTYVIYTQFSLKVIAYYVYQKRGSHRHRSRRRRRQRRQRRSRRLSWPPATGHC